MKDFLNRNLAQILDFQIKFTQKLKVIWRNGDRLGLVPIIGLQAGKKIILISHTVIFLETKTSTRPKTLI